MPTHKMRAGGVRQVAQARVHRLRDREALVKRTIGQQLPVRSRKRIVSSTQSAATHPSPRALGRHCHRTTPGCYTCCTGETLRIRASPQQDSISGAREMLYINCVLTRHVRYDIGSRSTRTYQQPVLQYCCAPQASGAIDYAPALPHAEHKTTIMGSNSLTQHTAGTDRAFADENPIVSQRFATHR
jgi:hypothetical protein